MIDRQKIEVYPSQIYETVEGIIESLDDRALAELTSGSVQDVDELIRVIYQEASGAINTVPKLISDPNLTSLVNISESIEQTLRFQSFNYFTASVLPDFEVNWHHIEWGNLIQLFKYLGIIAARDHSKSFTFSKAYPLWKLYRYKKWTGQRDVFSHQYGMSREGLLVTNEITLGRHLLGMVSEEIQHNPILHEALMPSNKQNLGVDKLDLKNGASLIVKSAGSRMRGLHPTFIIVDDFLDESSLYSAEQRSKFWNIFSAVIMNMISPGGEVKVVGTPFHEDDLYTQLKKSGTFKIFEYPAIMPDGSLLWPGRHNLLSLTEKRNTQGSTIFSREILVKPVSDSSSIFPYTILDRSRKGMDGIGLAPNFHSTFKKMESIHIGCDFALSSSASADYSVFTVVGVDDLNKIYVLNTWRKKGASYSEQVAVVKKMYRDFRPDSIFVESNQAQMVFGQLLRDEGVPAIDAHTGVNKYSLYKGLPALAALFETGIIRFPYGTVQAKAVTDLYHSELNSMTFNPGTGKLEGAGSHDDTAMSLWLAVRAAKYDDNFFKVL